MFQLLVHPGVVTVMCPVLPLATAIKDFDWLNKYNVLDHSLEMFFIACGFYSNKYGNHRTSRSEPHSYHSYEKITVPMYVGMYVTVHNIMSVA